MMQQKTQFENENELEEVTTSILENKGLICKRQARIKGKIPDIIAYEKRSDQVLAIEVKLKNWKVGLYQAFLNRNLADFSFLCMPTKYITYIQDKLENDFDKMGIGLIEVDPENRKIYIKKTAEKNSIGSARKNMIKQIICDKGGEK